MASAEGGEQRSAVPIKFLFVVRSLDPFAALIFNLSSKSSFTPHLHRRRGQAPVRNSGYKTLFLNSLGDSGEGKRLCSLQQATIEA